MSDIAKARRAGRLTRHRRVRKKIHGTAARPRLAVFRSNKHIVAQVIDDDAGVTLAAASTGSRFDVWGSQSTRTGVAFTTKRGITVDRNVNVGASTSSPAFRPRPK